MLSFWEKNHFEKEHEIIIVGAGLVGLSTAIALAESKQKIKVTVIERGMLPYGASTKNAGFACFGSPTEILDDLKTHTEEEVIDLIAQRYEGLQILRSRVGDEAMEFQSLGSEEWFKKGAEGEYDLCVKERNQLNSILEKATGKPEALQLVESVRNPKLCGKIRHQYEGQLNPQLAVGALWKKAIQLGVEVFVGHELKGFDKTSQGWELRVNDQTWRTRNLVFATNAFSKSFLPQLNVKPARAQVLITEPLLKCPLKGTYHMDKGYLYFRNVGNRILLGGARNLDITAEETQEFQLSKKIQEYLDYELRSTILPGVNVEVEHRWVGIMGIGDQKKPIIQCLDEGLYCGIRMGGMGVALSSQVASKLADLVLANA